MSGSLAHSRPGEAPRLLGAPRNDLPFSRRLLRAEHQVRTHPYVPSSLHTVCPLGTDPIRLVCVLRIRETLNNLILRSPQEWQTQVGLPFVKIEGKHTALRPITLHTICFGTDLVRLVCLLRHDRRVGRAPLRRPPPPARAVRGRVSHADIPAPPSPRSRRPPRQYVSRPRSLPVIRVILAVSDIASRPVFYSWHDD